LRREEVWHPAARVHGFLNGTLDIHVKLEEKLASFFPQGSGAHFSTGYQTNLGIISSSPAARCGRDRQTRPRQHHRCVQAILCRGQKVQGTAIWQALNSPSRKAGTTVNSWSWMACTAWKADIAPLPDIIKVCRKYGARLMVDDAHGIGVLGKTGRGTVEHFGWRRKSTSLWAPTVSHWRPSAALSRRTRGAPLHEAHLRPLIFSASPPPLRWRRSLPPLTSSTGTGTEGALWPQYKQDDEGFKQKGYDTGVAETPSSRSLSGDGADVHDVEDLVR